MKAIKFISLQFLREKFPIISKVGHNSTYYSCFVILSVKYYLILMCFLKLLLYSLPLFSILVVLWLSWYITLSRILYSCYFKKYPVNITWVRTLSTPTSLASVELLVFSFFNYNVHRSLMFPLSQNHQYGPSCPCAPQMLHQHTTLCFHNCLLTGSMIRKWCLLCTSSPFPGSFNHRYQSLSLYCIKNILPNVCLVVITLTGKIAALQNDKKVLRQFGTVWSHLPQYQKVVFV